MLKSVRCLCILTNIEANVWCNIMALNEFQTNGILIVLSLTNRLIDILECTICMASARAAQTRTRTPDRYMGYDHRDKKDFNMEGYPSPSISEEKVGDVDSEEEVDAVSTLLLLLQGIYGQKSSELARLLEGSSEWKSTVVNKMSVAAKRLLLMLADLNEEEYSRIIRVVASMNLHFAPSLAQNRTEVPLSRPFLHSTLVDLLTCRLRTYSLKWILPAPKL